MPIIESEYKPSTIFKNGFISTVYSGIIRKVKSIPFKHSRERLELSDGDFLDLDWDYSKAKTEKLLILLHGLEGSSERSYMTGSGKLFNSNDFDVLRVNFRGCSGEVNSKYRSYHSGATEDLKEIIEFVLTLQKYQKVFLKGFSLGGNVILKYLGENEDLPKEIKGAVAISVPCNLEGSARSLVQFKNIPFAIRFKRSLLKRLREKQKKFPDKVSSAEINKIKTLIDFDDIYTSKAHGFESAEDYYSKSSSLQFLPNISVPTLIINALNDSFLSKECYPIKEAKENKNLYLEMPKYGGHVGFHQPGLYYYNEIRALEFFKDLTVPS